MRPILYWLSSLFVAVIAAKAAGRADSETISLDAAMPLLAVADPVRSVLLGAGVLALAFTYRQAWAAFRGR
ncbi:MAG TPA: hypothetical protein DIT13_19910 [Verrucomicrobiales bacterium]|nr:hypothetical protein [Verrucomicrobiales bacterium]HRJ10738.1 hypothetical protein [Prosthecobacter sp.]HRK16707.1 hypothetical protein [Prosthecobacter sp.]